VTTWILALGLALAAATPAAQARAAVSHADELARLEARLEGGDSTGAATWIRSHQDALDADERFALDTIYVLVGQRRFDDAKAQWNRLAGRLQASLKAASAGPLGPAAEAELKRRVAEAFFVQGLLSARGGNKEEALRLLGQADGYGFPPLDSPLMQLAGDCLQELGQYKMAEAAYRELLKRAPENAALRLRLATALYASGQLASAQQELEALLRRAPSTPRARFYLGAVLFEQKRYDDARAQLEQELARDPRCLDCLAKLAHVAYLAGDDRQCEAWLAKASAIDANHPEASLVSGMLALRAGRYAEAVLKLSRVVALSPGYATAQYQLALAYQRSGQPAKAREHFEIYSKLIREEKARTIGVRGSRS
jgi:tetratricopeptide (TPR) repeat protein